MIDLFNNLYSQKKVLITGHTGFKGAWLALWLSKMGANVLGVSIDVPTKPNHFNLLNLKDVKSLKTDIRDRSGISKIFEEFKPEIVFHLAAQSLVLSSYDDPITTYETNVLGTLNILEACRYQRSVRALINVTSDKCYENKEWVWGYRENDAMGGYDPYSSSKGCAEILASSYRNSFFHPSKYGVEHNCLLASVRAGNVIGGGDWAENRLVPDIMRSAEKGEETVLRNPGAIRPWQHVLEPLRGYLSLGQKLLEEKVKFADGWNFGPNESDVLTVLEVAQRLKVGWEKINYKILDSRSTQHEANILKLDCSKAKSQLQWYPALKDNEQYEWSACWYRSFYEDEKLLSEQQLNNYANRCS